MKKRFSIHVKKEEVKLRRRIAPPSKMHRDKKNDYDRRKNKENEE